jgi:hypothetical protein
MVALLSNASIGLNSVAGEGVDFALATAGVSPTVIIATSRTLCNYHEKYMRPHTGPVSKVARWFQARTLDAGRMPSHNMLNQLAHLGPTAELSLEKLRLLIVSYCIDDDPDIRLSTDQLTDLRIFTGARIVYALTAPGVAGAVTQTHVFDYRNNGSTHFGAPLSSIEITLTGHPEDAGLERAAEGEVNNLLSSIKSNRMYIVNSLIRLLSLARRSSLRRYHFQLVGVFAMITRWSYVANALSPSNNAYYSTPASDFSSHR